MQVDKVVDQIYIWTRDVGTVYIRTKQGYGISVTFLNIFKIDAVVRPGHTRHYCGNVCNTCYNTTLSSPSTFDSISVYHFRQNALHLLPHQNSINIKPARPKDSLLDIHSITLPSPHLTRTTLSTLRIIRLRSDIQPRSRSLAQPPRSRLIERQFLRNRREQLLDILGGLCGRFEEE